MLFRILPSRLLLAAAVLALPLLGSGCGRKACFTWTAHEGACPAQSEALPFFSDPRCPGQITSVESAPTSELDGELCCYDVIADENATEADCSGGFGGANGTGGFGQSSAFTGVTSAAAGQGGAGGTTSCAHCADSLDEGQQAVLCNDTTAFLVKTLQQCACTGGCSMPCENDFCAGLFMSPQCFACLQEEGQGCTDALDACFADKL